MSKQWSFLIWARQKGLPSGAIDAIMKSWKENSYNRWPTKRFVKAFIEGAQQVKREMNKAGVNSVEELAEYRKKQQEEKDGAGD